MRTRESSPRFRTRRPVALLLGLLAASAVSLPALVDAQPRRARVVRRPVVVTTRVYRPFYGPRFYHPYFFGFGGWSPFWGGPWSPYWGAPWPPYQIGPELGSARLKVTPRDTEVYLDGRLVGVVDDFDGRFQRLRVPPGQYVLELYREGMQTWSRPVLLTPGSTLDIEHVMVPLASGDQAPERPAPVAPAAEPAAAPPRAPANPGPGRRRGGRGAEVTAATGTALSVRVQPPEAEILIDGEAWDSPAPGSRLIVHVAPGRRHLLVRAEGYEPYESDIDVADGDTRVINVSLRPQPSPR